jgi:hypothetical protein
LAKFSVPLAGVFTAVQDPDAVLGLFDQNRPVTVRVFKSIMPAATAPSGPVASLIIVWSLRVMVVWPLKFVLFDALKTWVQVAPALVLT